jgi:hypothetical protein
VKGLDLRGFRKHSEDHKTAVLIHPKGHEIKIAKTAVDERTRKAISALPFAEGGEVPKKPEADRALAQVHEENERLKSQQQSPADGRAETFQSTRQKYGGYAQGGEVALPEAPVDEAQLDQDIALGNPNSQLAIASGQPMSPEATGIPTAQRPTELASAPPLDQPDQGPSVLPPPTSTAKTPGLAGLGQVQKGMKAEAQAIGDLGQQQAQIEDSHATQLQMLEANYQKHHQDLSAEYEGIHKDIADTKIDPDRLWHSKSTGSKVAASLGIILSGLGSGLTGQPNLAMHVIDKAIDHDVEAQKTDLQNKHSLLKSNLDRTRDLTTATMLTKAQLLAVTEAQLKKAAAQAATPMAAAQYQQKAGMLQLQMSTLADEAAKRQTMTDALRTPALAGNPEVAAKAVQVLVPKEHQAAAYKDLTEITKMHSLGTNAMNVFDQVSKMTFAGSLSPHQRDALIQPVLANMVKQSEGRITPQDVPMVEALFPSGRDVGGATAVTKRRQLARFFNDRMKSSILTGNGIPVPQVGGGSSTGASSINFTPAKR